jgi:hypothetical protein
MKFRGTALVLTVLFSLSPLSGEEAPSAPAGAEEALLPLPLSPLLEILAAGDLFWRPDWPEAFPPDAFSLASGRALSIVLISGTETLILRRDPQGRLLEFPFFFNGTFTQVQAAYAPSGLIRRLSAETPGDPWSIDFPEDFLLPGNAAPVRVNRAGTWYFVLFLEAGFILSETWYDGEGKFFAWYQARIRRDRPSWRIRSLEFRGEGAEGRETRDYDSEDNITAVNSSTGNFSALYRGGRPQYWTRIPLAAPAPGEPPPDLPEQPGKFILQWDERGLLTGKRPEEGEGAGEFRYEYETGLQGNWTGRQDIEMISLDGVLVPFSRGTYERQIVYAEE